MIRAWRLTRRGHATPAREAFSGSGAELYGGRWNRVGTRAAYVSSTRSLAALEFLANVDPEDLPDDLVFVGISFDEDDVEVSIPPHGWDSLGSSSAMDFGEAWLRMLAAPVLRVPSAIIKAERNYMINPAHVRAAAFAIDPDLENFVFDERLIGP